MFSALRRLLGASRDPDQLEIPLVESGPGATGQGPGVGGEGQGTPALDQGSRRLPRDPRPDSPRARRIAGEQMLVRLRGHGLKRITTLRLTRNRNVMVSFRGTELRVQAGFAEAPDEVLRAIVRFVEGRTRAERQAAQKVIVSHPLPAATVRPAKARRERIRPEDRPVIERLTAQHAALNAQHFGGALKPIPIRISRRMKRRLGHYSAATATSQPEIAIGWRHLRRNGWTEALHTLLHEMVHQWQDETGRPLDHGPEFRRKAREVGITAAAKRIV